MPNLSLQQPFIARLGHGCVKGAHGTRTCWLPALAGCWFFLLEDTNSQKKSSNTSSIISPTEKKNSSIDLPLKDRGDHPGISGMDTCLFPDYRIITFWFLAPKCCFFRLILSTSLSETLLKKAHLPTLSLQIFEQSFVQRHLTCH